MSETIIIKSSLPKKELKKAYKKGVKITKIDICNQVCSEYEETTIDIETYNKIFVALDLKDSERWSNEDPDDEDVWLDTDSFADLYLLTCKKGDPSFEYEVVDGDSIDIGGYGLFVN